MIRSPIVVKDGKEDFIQEGTTPLRLCSRGEAFGLHSDHSKKKVGI